MAVRFVLGRAGAGKTRHCVDAILAELTRTDEQRRLILLVPEQASFQMEHALATRSPHGGMSRAEVLSFSRLARRVFDRSGPQPEVLNPQARRMALRHVAARSAAGLQVLRRAAGTPGFLVQLDRLIEELLREEVTPEALAAAAGGLKDTLSARKVREIAGLYGAYLAWLGPERTDAAARLALLRQRLAAAAWLDDASVWVDGFAGFTGGELHTLVALAGRARDVTITLLLDPTARAVRDPKQPPDELGLFRRTELTYQALRGLFADAGVEVAPALRLHPEVVPRFAAAAGLAALEAGLAGAVGTGEQRTPGSRRDSEITLRECATARDELRAAARWVRTLIADSGGELRFRDFAVIARDLEPYAELVAEVFGEYEIPHFLDRRRSLRGHPLNRLLAALFEAVRTDLEVTPMVRLLRTRLLPLTRAQAERLENLVVGQAMRGADLWRRARWELEKAHAAGESFDVQRARIVGALEPLLALAEQGSATGELWAATLWGVLEQLEVRGCIEKWIGAAQAAQRYENAETHRLAWETLCETLDNLHDVLSDTELTADEVGGIITAVLGEATVGLAPPTVDQVLVGSIERSRHPDITCAWVLGFNEGVFPARPAEDTLLSTAERDGMTRAGLAAPTSRRDEAFGERLLAYIALTRAARGLTVSYALMAEDGEALLPSPLLAELKQAVPGLEAERVPPDEPPVSVAELARGYLRSRENGRHVCGRYERLCARVGRESEHGERLAWLLRGLDYTNEPPPVGNYRLPSHAPRGVVWDGSASEVETYLQCPFKHFAKYGLWLDPTRGPQPLRWDLGTAAHEILADVTRRAMREEGGVRAVTDSRWRELLDEAVRRFWQGQPEDVARRRPDYAFLGEVLAGLLRDVVGAHAARWRRSAFEPLCCEQKFESEGGAGVLPGIELTLGDGRRMRLHGRIDRVDTCRGDEGTWLLVYDYKSRADTVGGRFLTGARLQLFVYLLAAQQTPDEQASVRPAGVFLAPLYPDLDVLGRKYAAGADEHEQLMYMFRPRGLFSEQVGRLLDTQLGTSSSPVAQMGLKKAGGFTARGDTQPAGEIERYLELARRTVVFAVEGAVRGRIEVAPLVESKTLPCRYCDYQSVCRFERPLNHPRGAEAVLPLLDDVGGQDGGAV